MNAIPSIKLKAAILLLVFSLNTLRSLACAMDMDGILDSFFNTIHHHFEGGKEVNASCKGNNECKCIGNDERDATEKDGCCDTKVVSFDQLEKFRSQTVTGNLGSPVFALPTFLLINSSIHSCTSSIVLNYIFRNFHAPPEDIRLSIRSFQI